MASGLCHCPCLIFIYIHIYRYIYKNTFSLSFFHFWDINLCTSPPRGKQILPNRHKENLYCKITFTTIEIFRLYFGSEVQYILTTSMQDLAKCHNCSLAGLLLHIKSLVHIVFVLSNFIKRFLVKKKKNALQSIFTLGHDLAILELSYITIVLLKNKSY